MSVDSLHIEIQTLSMINNVNKHISKTLIINNKHPIIGLSTVNRKTNLLGVLDVLEFIR